MLTRQHLLFIGVTVALALTALCLGAADRASAASAGDIVINEIMKNPSKVSDSSGEWFELANTTATSIDIQGWCVLDKDGQYFTISSSLVIAANTNTDHYVVLGVNSDSGTNGGLTVDYKYTYGTGHSEQMVLANTSDEVVLVEPDSGESCGSWGNLNQPSGWSGTVIDEVEYDNGATFPNPDGASMAFRRPSTGQTTPGQENDSGSNWYTSTSTYGDGDKGTPGARNADAPTAIVLVNLVAASQEPRFMLAVRVGLFVVTVMSLSFLISHRRPT